MQQPFDLEIGDINYAIFPEGNDIYIVFKDGKEYAQIQKDDAEQWIKFDKETAIPVFEYDEEVNQIGKLISAYLLNPEQEEEDDDLED
ncbi:hypothetical protein GM921_12540 [Pedobacter sp. LMG 31464]|uniref:Uncharacterized protein n=1 Tax=Pedobacter planticolens TaxID=2679964 RepID=A0A923E081_9SPHI|nr:hypothetical protein [Pedobacter planticolens]MBB2146321.1 hypothetical protein [Pedobacter planticolens]